MGIRNFYTFLSKYAPRALQKTTLHNYRNKTLGIDANLLLYKLLENNIKSDSIDYETYYFLLIKIISHASRYNIKLLFVFDGPTPDIKKKTVKIRQHSRYKAKQILKEFIETRNSYSIDTDITETELKKKEISLKLDSIHLSYQLIEDTKKFLLNSGISFMDAKHEADSQLAYLSKINAIDGIITNDYDILTFGGVKIIVNLFDYIYKTNNYCKTAYEINLNTVLFYLDITFNSFIDLCILMGTDYSCKPDISFDDAYLYIKMYHTFDSIIKLVPMIVIPDNLNYELIFKYFTDCYAHEYIPKILDINAIKIIKYIYTMTQFTDKTHKNFIFLLNRKY
jgi:flap endonuclease-1